MTTLEHIVRSCTRAWSPSSGRREAKARAHAERGFSARSDIAARAVLRVYRGDGNRWYVQREGHPAEGAFVSRTAAIEFARLIGMGAGSYRAFLETSDGDVVEERFIPR